MRRFSQRSSLVTLSEINITPLLDLAFVLLIIFVITTPLLEQGLHLQLPPEGKPDQPYDRKDIHTVEVSTLGVYLLDGRRMSLDAIDVALAQIYRSNPKLLVYIRADEDGPYKLVAAILNRCEQRGITRISLRTDPIRRHR